MRQIAGHRIGFWSVPGEVVAVDRWSETSVSSSSGAVYLVGNHVSVSAPKIWASAEAHKAVWIKTATSELQIAVPNDLAIRAGHRVHAVAASQVEREKGQWSAIVNHDTRRWQKVDSAPPGWRYDPWTNFFVGFSRGFGDQLGGAFTLYIVPCVLLFSWVLHYGWEGAVTGAIVAYVVALRRLIFAARTYKKAVAAYARAVQEACYGVFAAEQG